MTVSGRASVAPLKFLVATPSRRSRTQPPAKLSGTAVAAQCLEIVRGASSLGDDGTCGTLAWPHACCDRGTEQRRHLRAFLRSGRVSAAGGPNRGSAICSLGRCSDAGRALRWGQPYKTFRSVGIDSWYVEPHPLLVPLPCVRTDCHIPGAVTCGTAGFFFNRRRSLAPPAGAVDITIAHSLQTSVPRLPQRFYRAGKARSRDMGGTGLRLAIVKYTVLVHGGGLRIKSRVTHSTVRVALSVDTLGTIRVCRPSKISLKIQSGDNNGHPLLAP